MIPFLGDSGKRRNINLGGSTASTHAAIMDQAKARRMQREHARKQDESVLKLQAWFRGRSQACKTRQSMQKNFASMSALDAARYLVIFGNKDEPSLHLWSSSVVQNGNVALSNMLQGPQSDNWRIVLPQLALVILETMARSPDSASSLDHIQCLNIMFTPAKPFGITSADYSLEPCRHLTVYLVKRGFYKVLRDALLRMPPDRKYEPCLPPLSNLCTAPIASTLPSSPFFGQVIEEFFQHIMTIPQLLNRLPLPSVTSISAHIPFSHLDKVDLTFVTRLSLDSRAHLAANLSTFAVPRYIKLPSLSLEVYLRLLTGLICDLPVSSLEGEKREEEWLVNSAGGDSDEEGPAVIIVDDFSADLAAIHLDHRTVSRLKSLTTSTHLQPLMTASTRHPKARSSLFSFVLALCDAWPLKRESTWSLVSAFGGPGLVRETYRGWVRSSPLGKPDSVVSLTDASNVADWPPLLFTTELYSHMLLTMGDDEFFAPSHQTPRNPLTLEEVMAFSRQLLGISFTLYWNQDQHAARKRCLPNLRLTWEGVRDRCTRCIQSLHARDSRRPFTSPEHWLWTHQFDIDSFVEAAVSEENELEPDNRRISKRQVAYLSPRLGVLNNIPFAIPFEVRVAIFRSFIYNDQRRLGYNDYHHRHRRTRVTVRREKVAQDGFDQLREANLKGEVQITFIDQFGNEEMGIDGGGVFKEFLTSLVKEVFDSDRGLWLENRQRELYPNPHIYATEVHSLNWFHFIGRILGKALYEGILVDVAFAGFFLAKWLDKHSFLDDLASLDQDLYNGLMHLKREPDPESLSLDFTVTEDDFGVPRTVDLIPNGSSISVTRQNRFQYIHLVSHYHLSRKIRLQSNAFFEGLATMVDPKWLRMFNQQEMQLLISGANTPIDVDDLKHNTQYGGVYDENEATIRLFWKVVAGFDQEERRALLRFATSCGRPPLLGFKELSPKFSIRDSGNDQTRLPTASTCVNLLKLPRYQNEVLLREKILQAIHSGAGFDLS